MSEDRRQILGLLAEGKITADEAERLIGALGGAANGAGFRGPMSAPTGGSGGATVLERPSRPKYLRVMVQADEPGDGAATVNVRVPMQLLRAGVKLSHLIPPRAREEVNRALAREGIAFDINQIKPENLEELIDQLGDLSVDVDSGAAKVRVFCE